MELRETLIEEYVRLANQTLDNAYRQGLESTNQLSLQGITPDDVRRVIKPFLYNWGGMQRVVGRDEYAGWQEKVANAIQANQERLAGFRAIDLEEADLDRHESDLKICYTTFEQIIGPTASAKILHCICPSFFPPWDTKIRNGARIERRAQEKSTGGQKLSYTEDYWAFTQQIQSFVHRNRNLINRLSLQYEKTKVKVADDCLWMAATGRPLYCVFRTESG